MDLDLDRRTFLEFCSGCLIFNLSSLKAKGQSNLEEASWKMYQRDSLNSGYEPNFSGFGSEIEVEWEVELEDEIYASPSISNGKIYAVTSTGKLYGINIQSGQPEWNVSLISSDDRTNQNKSSPAVVNGKVIVGSANKWVYCYSSENGAEIWRTGTGGSVYSSPTIFSGTVFVGCDDGKLYSLDVETGEANWTFDAGDEIRSTPAVTTDLVYFGMNSSPYNKSNFFAVDIATGQEVWSFEADSSIVSSPSISGENVYIADTSGNLYALDKQNGTRKWIFSDADGGIQSTLAVTNDSISFVGSQKVYCLNMNGNELWNYDIGYNSTSDVAASKEEIYIGSEDMITGIEIKNGTARWRIETEDAVEGIPAISGKKLYIGDNSGKLYSISEMNTNTPDEPEDNTENQSVEDG